MHVNKFKRLVTNEGEGREADGDESISDTDLENIVGFADNSELEVHARLEIVNLFPYFIKFFKWITYFHPRILGNGTS